MMSKSEILYHLFDLLNSSLISKNSSLKGEYGELYEKIMNKHADLYNRRACHVYARQCAIIGVLAEYLGEDVQKIDEPTCVKCGGCKRFTGR